MAEDNPIIPSNIYLTLAMGVMLGLGDGGFNVSIYAALGSFYQIFEKNSTGVCLTKVRCPTKVRF